VTPALFVEETGPPDAPVVLLIHGSMDRSRSFGRVARSLDGDLRVVRYDRRGYGRSVATGGPFTMDAHVADAAGVLAGRRAVVVGHSYGGDVAIALAERHPELARAVGAWEAPMVWEPWWPGATAAGDALAAAGSGSGSAEAAERFMRRMIGDDRWEGLPERTRNARRAEGPALLGEIDDLRVGPPYRFDAVAVPVVAGCGTRSRRHHREAARRLAALAGTPLVEVDGADHGAHLTHPAQFAAFVRTVVAQAPD
jgi:pimeloyl-ACP methyl ester carboxylesterase